ncbi:hypothetical protein N665_0110s0001 [Sinapis alba]|nr:hypothetical protein N665_0110s0001 [Sinapis alba]
MSPIRRCSSKGKSIAIASGSMGSESLGSPLVGRPRAITLGGMEGLRFPTGADLAELNNQECSVVHFSINLENRVMDWTDFEIAEEIDPEKVHRFSFKKNQKWENHLPTRSSFKSHQRPWTPPVGYACVYESCFNNCRLWGPLPELLTIYCSRRKIALVRLFEEITTPSITAKIRFFYRKMVPKYNVLTGKPSKVNHWNQPYFYVKINEASFKDPVVILNGYFNANIDIFGKWDQSCSDSFWEQVEAIRTLSHQHWPDISEIRIQAALNIIKRRKKMGKFNLASLPSYAASIGTPPAGQEGSSSGTKFTERRKTSHSDEGALNLPEENWGSSPPASQDDEVVEYPHLVNFRDFFCWRSLAPTRLFHQIKLKSKGMPELDELSQRGRYWYYEAMIKVHKEKLALKSKSLKKKKKEKVKLKGKWDMYKEKVGQITTEKDQAMEMAEMEKSRGELLFKDLEEIKAQKEMLESCLRELDQKKVEADSKFEKTTKRLRESREHEMMLIYEKMRQYLDEQPAIQSKLILYSPAKGAKEGLEKIQAFGMSIDEVLEQLNAMEVTNSSEINLQPLGLDEHGSNLQTFSP